MSGRRSGFGSLVADGTSLVTACSADSNRHQGVTVMFTAGIGKICISPAPGAPLAGFAARQGMAAGVHDDLFARALVLENRGQAVALVSVDVLALPNHFVARVRTAINECLGIETEGVMIASTHTHAGPVTITTFFNPDESLD